MRSALIFHFISMPLHRLSEPFSSLLRPYALHSDRADRVITSLSLIGIGAVLFFDSSRERERDGLHRIVSALVFVGIHAHFGENLYRTLMNSFVKRTSDFGAAIFRIGIRFLVHAALSRPGRFGGNQFLVLAVSLREIAALFRGQFAPLLGSAHNVHRPRPSIPHHVDANSPLSPIRRWISPPPPAPSMLPTLTPRFASMAPLTLPASMSSLRHTADRSRFSIALSRDADRPSRYIAPISDIRVRAGWPASEQALLNYQLIPAAPTGLEFVPISLRSLMNNDIYWVGPFHDPSAADDLFFMRYEYQCAEPPVAALELKSRGSVLFFDHKHEAADPWRTSTMESSYAAPAARFSPVRPSGPNERLSSLFSDSDSSGLDE